MSDGFLAIHADHLHNRAAPALNPVLLAIALRPLCVMHRGRRRFPALVAEIEVEDHYRKNGGCVIKDPPQSAAPI